MKMMSCIFDDEGEYSTSSSNSYEQQHQIPPEKEAKRKLNFISKKKAQTLNSSSGPKVQRSASAIFRSKVYAVVSRKQKKNSGKRDQGKERKKLSSII